MDLDFNELISGALKGSSVIDTAISQVFGANPIDMKLKEIGYLLEKHCNIVKFEYYFDVVCLTYNYKASFYGDICYGAITDEMLRNTPVECIVKEIANQVMTELAGVDPEYMFANENEQAMLDAARDYGFV